MDTTEAKALLEKEQKERAERCLQRILETLKEERCIMSPLITIEGNQINTSFKIIAE